MTGSRRIGWPDQAGIRTSLIETLEADKIKCLKCKANMHEIITTFNSRWGDYTIAIEGVKAHKCNECEEMVFSSKEARMIQNITAGFADSQAEDKPDFLNVQETADMFRVSNQTVYNILKDGRLSVRKVGKGWRFSKDEGYEAGLGKSAVSVAARVGLSQKDREFTDKNTGQ